MTSNLFRLVTVDVTRDGTTCLACVYLNEYKVASAAFTLHASENKIIRVSQLFINSVVILCFCLPLCISLGIEHFALIFIYF